MNVALSKHIPKGSEIIHVSTATTGSNFKYHPIKMTHDNVIHKILNKLRKKQKILNYLNAEITSVNIITQKQVTGVCRLASHFKQLHKVIKLTMYIPTDCKQNEI